MKKNQEIRQTFDTEVLVVGGGVIGLACAYYLAQAGRKVHLIEQDLVGSGASHGNCGLLYFSDLMPLCQPGAVRRELGRMLQRTSPLYVKYGFDLPRMLWLLKFAVKCNRAHMQRALKAREKLIYLSRRLYDDLLNRDRLPCDWKRRGLLMVYKNQAAMDRYEKINVWLKPYGLGARPLGKSDLLKMEPALLPDVCGAWYHEADSHLRPEKFLTALKAAALQKGVLITEQCRLERFILTGRTLEAAITNQGRFNATRFVLATGAWAPLQARQLSFSVPIQPGKGYSLTTGRPEICPGTPCYFYDLQVLATPWPDGLRLGGTMEFSGFNTQIDSVRIANLKRAAMDYLRPSPSLPILEAWAGLRPMTFDDLPVIGPAPGHPNLILATGHGMLGITMAPGTGQVVADLICGQKTAIDLWPFRPERFK